MFLGVFREGKGSESRIEASGGGRGMTTQTGSPVARRSAGRGSWSYRGDVGLGDFLQGGLDVLDGDGLGLGHGAGEEGVVGEEIHLAG